MKLAFSLELFLKDRPFLDRIRIAADLGYEYADMFYIDQTSGETGPKDAAAIAKTAREAGVTITNALIDGPNGKITGGLTNPAHREAWLKRADRTFAFCNEAEIGAVIVCTGDIVEGISHEEMRRAVIDGLKTTAEKAEAAGIDLWLEPLNDRIDHTGYFCTGSDQGAEICRAVGSPRMKMLFDIYHMQIMEGDLAGHVERNLDVIAQFHLAGHPGRHEPWLGEINYPFLLPRIVEMGYEGVFSLEYAPTLPVEESLRRTREYLMGNQ